MKFQLHYTLRKTIIMFLLNHTKKEYIQQNGESINYLIILMLLSGSWYGCSISIGEGNLNYTYNVELIGDDDGYSLYDTKTSLRIRDFPHFEDYQLINLDKQISIMLNENDSSLEAICDVLSTDWAGNKVGIRL